MQYDFSERYNMSTQTEQLETDIATLRAYFPDVADVKKTDAAYDKRGIDYIVTLKSGAKIGVDVKTREKGCSRYWENGPEIALETWSQKWPDYEDRQNKVGWTIDTNKRCHYVMFKFDPSDSTIVYILPFQQLNMAFRRNKDVWYSTYHHAYQTQAQANYESECIFVPVDVVIEAVKNEFVGETISSA